MDWIIANHCNDQPVAGFSGQPNLSTSRFRGVVKSAVFGLPRSNENRRCVRDGFSARPAPERHGSAPLGGCEFMRFLNSLHYSRYFDFPALAAHASREAVPG